MKIWSLPAALLVANVVLTPGCGLIEAQAPSLDILECKVRVLEPYLGDESRHAVLEALGGKINPGSVLYNLGVAIEEINKVGDAWKACGPDLSSEPPVSSPPVKPDVLTVI